MAFEQCYIKCVEGTKDGKIVYFTFNPEKVSFSKSLKWTPTTKPTKDNPDVDFSGGNSFTFSIQKITLDATMPALLKDSLGRKGDAVGGNIVADVELLMSFTKVDDTLAKKGNKVTRPAMVQFWWGQYKSFKAYLQKVSVDYVLFDETGKPLRAEVGVDFIEADDEVYDLPYQNPTSRSLARKVRTVMEGETLDWIAYQEYGTAAAWRHIAETNNLDDPSDVRPGQLLRLVPLN